MKKRIASRLRRVCQRIRIAFYAQMSSVHSEGKPRKRQPVLMMGDGVLRFGKDVILGYFPSPFYLTGCIYLEARHKGASIVIGDGCAINNNFTAVAEHTEIVIGKRCLIGTNVEILDSDFHGLRVAERAISDPRRARRVLIGDDVFLGSNVKVMKGVRIGDGSVIRNGSVVVTEIPSGVVAGGNPAVVLKVIEE